MAPPTSLTIFKSCDAWGYIAEADHLVRMARELSKRGHRVVVGCSRGTGLETRAREEGMEVRVVPGMRYRKDPFSFLRAAAATRRLVAELLPDVVHAYRAPPHLMGLWAVRGRPDIRLVRTRATMVPPRATFLNRRLHRVTDRTIVSAEAVRRLCVEAGFEEEKLVVLHGGLELERFDPAGRDPAAAKLALGFPADALVVGQLARLAPIKGQAHFLAAARRVAEQIPSAHFALVGPALPGMVEELHRRAAAEGLAERVRITGRVDDVPAALAAFDVGIVASVGSEALSRAALEYFAMGLPVVATSVGSLPELIEEGVTGHLVPPAAPQAMADALLPLLKDPDRRARMGEAARRAAASRFGAEAQALRLEALYRELVGRRR